MKSLPKGREVGEGITEAKIYIKNKFQGRSVMAVWEVKEEAEGRRMFDVPYLPTQSTSPPPAVSCPSQNVTEVCLRLPCSKVILTSAHV